MRNRFNPMAGLSRASLLVGGSIGLAFILFCAALEQQSNARRRADQQLAIRVYCAAGIAEPISNAIAEFNSTFGRNAELVRIGGSGELAGQIQTEFETGVQAGADLVVSADQSLLENQKNKRVISEIFPVATQKPVVAVLANHPAPPSDLNSMLASSMKFGVASRRAAVGKLTRRIAQQSGLLESLEQTKKIDAENVMTLAQALVTGSLDAAVIWNTTVAQVNQQHGSDVLKIAGPADPDDQTRSNIVVGVVATTAEPNQAIELATFISAPRTVQKYLVDHGYLIPEN